MAGFSAFVLRHRRAVGVLWLVMMLAGAMAAGSLSHRLSSVFAVPGAKSFQTNQTILRDYGNGAAGYPDVPVIQLPAGSTVDSPGVTQAVDVAFTHIAAADPRLRVVSYADGHDRTFVSADGRVVFGLVFKPFTNELEPLRLENEISQAVQPLLPTGATVRVTGLDILTPGGTSGKGPGVLVETLVAGVGALVVLVLVFGSAMAVVPVLMAVVSILSTMAIVWLMTTVTTVNIFVQFLVGLIGLGVAIDYSLLLVTRWREETARGAEPAEAVHRAMATAGRAIVFSGVTVAVGLLSLVLIPVPFLRSMGYGGLLIPLVSVLVTLTLLPSVLATVGPRVDRRRLHGGGAPDRRWTALARGVVRVRWVAAGSAVVVLALLCAAATGIKVGAPAANSLAKSGTAAQGLEQLEQAGIPSGVLTPMEALVSGGADPVAAARVLAGVPGVWGAVAPSGASWRHDASALVSVLPKAETTAGAGARTLNDVRTAAARELPGVTIGGAGANLVDESTALYQRFPLMLGGIAVITFLLLARAFRSLLLPLKAVVLNMVSVASAYGVITLIWQEGHGSKTLGGVPATGSITNWVPLMTFAFLFGLSMDYEVFILSRMREAYDRTGSTDAAVVEGVGHTGRLVTSAALVLFLAFASLGAGPETNIKIAATALGVGILLDATVVRALLLPALVSAFGRWNWWLPRPVAWLLRTEPSPLHAVADTSRASDESSAQKEKTG